MIGTTTLAIASLVAVAASTAVTYMGSQQQAASQQSALNYQAQVNANNAKIAQQNIQQSQLAEQQTEQQNSLKAAQTQGAIRAAEGAAGVDPNSGTPALLATGSKTLADSDALTIRSNYARQQFGMAVSGMSSTAQSQLDTMGANAAGAAGTYSGLNSILSGASSISSKWTNYQQSGLLAAGANP